MPVILDKVLGSVSLHVSLALCVQTYLCDLQKDDQSYALFFFSFSFVIHASYIQSYNT